VLKSALAYCAMTFANNIRDDNRGVELTEIAEAMQCRGKLECQWQLIRSREPGPLLIFGALSSSDLLGHTAQDFLQPLRLFGGP
jgi:hypothetical protein